VCVCAVAQANARQCINQYKNVPFLQPGESPCHHVAMTMVCVAWLRASRRSMISNITDLFSSVKQIGARFSRPADQPTSATEKCRLKQHKAASSKAASGGSATVLNMSPSTAPTDLTPKLTPASDTSQLTNQSTHHQSTTLVIKINHSFSLWLNISPIKVNQNRSRVESDRGRRTER
jgi:hypothetical protein